MAGNDHSGYPMKWFKDQNTARRFFECVICLEVLKDAVQVRDCGHQFCALCIDDILKANPRSPSCPSCRTEISDVLMVFADHAARRMINELEVNCCNEGCTWTGCLGSLLQSHQNNCNFLIQRDGNNAQKLKVEELEQKHDTLMLDVFLFKEKHEQDITDLKLKHEQDITVLKLKHEEDIKELKLKHQKDIGDLQMKHEKEKQELRDLKMKHEEERQVIREIQLKQRQEKQLQLKHEQNFEELKLKLQRTEDLLRRMRNEEKDLCEKEIPQKFSNAPLFQPVVKKNVKPVEIIPVQSDQPLDDDFSWEDKGDKIGDGTKVKDADTEAPAAEKTRIKYERDFLLQFRYMPVCCEKPAGLPEIEVVLDTPVQPGKGGGSQRASDFLPSYPRQKSQLKQSGNRCQQPDEKEKELTEEEKKSAELYRNVVTLLNKLTPQKFKSLAEQVMALNIDTRERLEGVIDRIFEKALDVPVLSVAYANMCRCLFTIKVTDAEGKDVSFHKLLISRCQKQFEKEREDEQALLERLNQLEGLSEEEKKIKKEEMEEALLMDKRRMLGNIKFIGELFKLKLLTENIMHDCIFKLLRAGDEDSMESLCKLLFTIGKHLDSDKAKPRIDQYFDQINKVIVNRKVSSRMVFMLRDVVELRENKWVPRRKETYNPKTIDQIYEEAEMKKKGEKRLAAHMQLPSKNNKQKKGGSVARDSPKPKANNGWITTGKGGKSAPVDQNKLRSIAKQANNEEISLGPSYSRFGQWGRGSSTGNNNSSQEQDKPEGHTYSALSSGEPSNRPYDPRRSASGGSSPSPGALQGSDKSRIKGDKDTESALSQQNPLVPKMIQNPYGPPVMRSAYIPKVQQAYQMQATSVPFQPQHIQQQQQYFNQGLRQPVYYKPNNQQIQQQQQPAQTTNPQIPAANTNKPKPKRSSKITIRNPKDHKDVTDEILSIHNNTANCRPGGTPPLTTSTAQTESSTIQAQFAAQVAARVGEKGNQGNEKKSENGDKDKKSPAKTDQTDVLKSDMNKSSESPSTTSSLTHENRTESPKNTTDDTHANQGSPTLGEMTDKLKMTIGETQNGPQFAAQVAARVGEKKTKVNEEEESD